MKWIKLHTDEWLNSTMRFTLNHKQRAVWADFLALGGKSRVPGIICAGEENGVLIGLPPARIAGIVDVAPDELSEILKAFERQERITIEAENGRLIIRLCNWSKYQSEYDRQKKYRQPSERVTGESDAKLHDKLQNATAKSDSVEVEGEGEREGERDQKKRRSAPAATAKAAQPVAFRSDLLTVNQTQDAKLADVYPWVNRPQEYGKMALWLEANRPGRNVRNALAFCQNWFNKIPCPSKGGAIGKPTATDLAIQNARALGLARPN